MRDARGRFAPALEQVAAWQLALGRAHDESAAFADPFARRELVRRLREVSRALAEVEEADDVDAALIDAVESTARLLLDARAVIAGESYASGASRRARDALSTLQKAIAKARLPTAEAARIHGAPSPRRARAPFTASHGSPAVGDPPREIVFVPGTEAAPEDLDADPARAWRHFRGVGAAPRTRASSRPPPEVLMRRDIRAKLRTAFEELGSLGSLRTPAPEEAWSDALLRFDRRLLAQYDAVIALAHPASFHVADRDGSWRRIDVHVDIGEELLAWAADAVPADTRRSFARAFVLASLRGRDAARAAVAGLADRDGARADAAAEAISLASSGEVPDAVRAACLDPAAAARAFEVSRRRGDVDVAVATVALAGGDAAIAAAAASALGASPRRDLALAALSHAVAAGLEPRVELAACEAGLALGAAWALRTVRERASFLSSDDEHLSAWLELLAIGGDLRDAATLRERTGDDPRRIEAWGLHGSVDLAAALVERIGGLPRGAAPAPYLRAFHRIAGVLPAAHTDGAALAAAWRSARATLDPAVRLRHGRPFTLLSTLEELGAHGVLQRDRRWLALEVSLVTRGAMRIAPNDWAARQTASIQSALEQVRAMHLPAGRFNAASLG